MPVDTSIFGGGGGGGRSGGGAFGMLAGLMQMKEMGDISRLRKQQIESGEALEQQRRNILEDDAAIKSTIAKYTPPDKGEVDFDQVVHELNQTGRGSAALKVQSDVLGIRKEQNARVQEGITNMKSRLGMASSMLQGVTDDASYQKVAPIIRKLVPEGASMLPAEYDKDSIDQVISMGHTNAEHLAGQAAVHARADKAFDRMQDILKENRDWAAKVPKLQHEALNIGSGLLSLARNQADWDAGLKMLGGAMNGLTPELKQSVLGQFGTTFSPQAKESARLLGMTQAERTQEKDRALGRSLERMRIDAEKKGDMDVNDLTPEGVDLVATAIAQGGLKEMPSFGAGDGGRKARVKIINRAAEMFKGLDTVSQAASAKALTGSIVKRTEQLSSISAYKATTLANLDNFVTSAQKVIDSGSPWLNKKLRDINMNLLGSEEQAVYNAARAFALPEVTRIINNPNLVGAATVSARKELNEAVPEEMTMKQILGVVRMARTDMLNRERDLNNEINVLQGVLAAPPDADTGRRSITAGRTPAGGGTTTAPAPGTGTHPPNSEVTGMSNGVEWIVKTDAQGNLIPGSARRK